MAAAAPFAIKAAPFALGALGSLFGKKASGPSAQQSSAMAGSQQATQALGQQGGAMAQQGQGYLGAAGDYYKNILGSRSAATNAMAPEMTNALEFYKGAQGKTQRTMRGGSRDYAMAELDRQKVGQMAGFMPQARRSAAQGASQAGSALAGQGMNAMANSAYASNGLFNQATQLKDQQQKGGNAWGSILYDAAGALFGGKGKSAPKYGPAF